MRAPSRTTSGIIPGCSPFWIGSIRSSYTPWVQVRGTTKLSDGRQGALTMSVTGATVSQTFGRATRMVPLVHTSLPPAPR